MTISIPQASLIGLTAFALSVIIAPGLIKYFRYLKYGQTIRVDGPATHKAKAGTPTMGGIIFLIGATVSIIVWMLWSKRVIVLLLIVLGFAMVGFIDDAIIIIRKRSLGLKARHKLFAEIALSSALAFYIYSNQSTTAGLIWRIPFSGQELALPLWLFFPLSVFAMVSSTNAVNLTDGLDGLAIGTSGIVLMALSILCYWSGYNDLMALCLAFAGACLGFAWFNAHPAQIIMGDTGSLALGGVIGGVALLSGNILFLPVLGGVFVAETLCVIIQVSLFKLTGQRLFKMSPLHHHFELSGWDEPKVVIRFWIAGLILALISLLAYLKY